MTNQPLQFVGSIPEHYDQGMGPRIFLPFAEDLAARIAGLDPARVLELAAGTGIVSRRIRDLLPGTSGLVVTDLNAPMLEVAEQKFEPDENVTFEVVDAMALGFPEASFDVVTCQFGVMFFPDKAKSFAQVLNVLQPGGHYVFNVWDSWAANPFGEIVHETVAGFFPDNPPGFYRVPFSCHDAGELQALARDEGFSRVSLDVVTKTSATGSASGFARGLVLGNPLYDEILARGGDPEEICAAVAEAVEERLGDEFGLQAIVVHATAPGGAD
jgi:SAM-dependent methyltransferase